MLVSIIGENTFKVGDKIFEVNDEITLEDMPPVEIEDFGTMPAEELRQKLVKVNGWIRDTKENLISSLHMGNKAYREDDANLCWDYVNAHRDWAYMVDILFKAIEKHLGGSLPLMIDPDTGKITIRTLKQDPREPQPENLNWTRPMIARQVQYGRYEGVREVALHILGEDNKENMKFSIDLLAELELPNILVDGDVVGELPLVDSKDPGAAAQAIALAGKEAFAKHQAQAPVCLVWRTEKEYLFIDMKEKLIPQQGRQTLPLPISLQQVTKKLDTPQAAGLLMFGDLSLVSEGKTGLIAVVINDSGDEKHCALAMEGNEFTALSDGDGLKIEKGLADMLRALVKKKEEEK